LSPEKGIGKNMKKRKKEKRGTRKKTKTQIIILGWGEVVITECRKEKVHILISGGREQEDCGRGERSNVICFLKEGGRWVTQGTKTSKKCASPKEKGVPCFKKGHAWNMRADNAWKRRQKESAFGGKKKQRH